MSRKKNLFWILSAIVVCFGISVWKSGNAPVLKKVKLIVAFGYKDTRPARLVGDRYERTLFVERMQEIGFVRSPADDDLLEFQNGKENFQLKVFHSSTGPDDETNREDPYQKHKSAQAKKQFLSALKEAEVVLYIGHSRDGGGPDFYPPRLTENGHVDYAFYRHEHAEADEMIAEMERSPNRPSQLGLLSCYSENHFSKKLKRVCSEKTSVTTIGRLIYYTEALQMAFDLISERINRS